MYSVAAIPARITLENKEWERAANLELTNYGVDWEKFPWQKAIHHFAKALGAAHTKNYVLVEKELQILKKLHQNLIAQNDRSKSNQVEQIEIQIKTGQAWLNFMKGDKENGLVLMREAVEIENNTSKHPVTPGDVLPAVELLGEMLLRLNKPKEALKAFEQNLNERPNRFNGLYGAAMAAKQIGDREKATLYFEQLLELTKNINTERPEIKKAKEFLGQELI
jgi:tetratricopeptide (TPR) repeat protein